MRPYGLKRILFIKWPDIGDCLERGISSKWMKIKSKNRQSVRRYHAKRARKYKIDIDF